MAKIAAARIWLGIPVIGEFDGSRFVAGSARNTLV
jgi:hypothetical protein